MEFYVGQKVNHKIYGEGTVVNILERTGAYGERHPSIITIDFGRVVQEYVIDCKTIRKTKLDFSDNTLADYLI